MTAVEFATRKIVFDESSAITGRFDIRKYRHLEKPLLDLDNIHIKRLTCIAASSSLKTVFLQIAMAYKLDQRPGSMQVAMESDDAAGAWMKVRGKKFLNRIPTLRDSLSNDKFAQTNSLWMWPHQFLLLTGPGESAQQAKQVTYLFTDESHVTEFREGSLTSFEERQSKRWNRQAIHVTTGADAGKEVDRFYYMGGQNEWHFRCPNCAKLILPAWEDDAKAMYNGQKVFIFGDHSDSVYVACPHCSCVATDTARGRYSLHEYGDYVSMKGGDEPCLRTHTAENLNAATSQSNAAPTFDPEARPSENQSYRWTFAACHWLPWSEALAKYREAIIAATMGNLKPHEDFQKKRLAKSYVPEIPDIHPASPSSDYSSGDVWIVSEPLRRFVSADVQDAPFHLWAQADEFCQNGGSRRLAYARLSTWEQLRQFQIDHRAQDSDTFVDAGFRDREVYGKCATYKWYALLARDEDSFAHTIYDPVTKKPSLVMRPYSVAQLQDSMSGKSGERIKTNKRIPPGFCLSRLWSKPKIGGLLMALKSGESRYYGIARDISPDYLPQLHSYVFSTKATKVNPLAKTLYLRQVKKDDHAFSTSAMCLVGAVIAGFFPMSGVDISAKEDSNLVNAG